MKPYSISQILSGGCLFILLFFIPGGLQVFSALFLLFPGLRIQFASRIQATIQAFENYLEEIDE
jgi:hypothetical protein